MGAEKWTTEYTEKPAAYEQGGGPFGMTSVYQPSLGKWVVLASTTGSGVWKYVEP